MGTVNPIRLLRPTRTVETILDVDYDELRAAGKRAMLFDLDGTLEWGRPSALRRETVAFLGELRRAGLLVGILSNRRWLSETARHGLQVDGVPVSFRAGKPRRGAYVRLMRRLDVGPAESVFIGDRRLTDILGANRAGLDTILVRAPAFPSNRRPGQRSLDDGEGNP